MKWGEGWGEGKWSHTPPHPNPLPASGAREQMRLAAPSPHEMGRVGVRGNGLFNSLPASGAREQMRLATPSPHEMGNRGRRPRSPEGQRAGVRGNGLIRPLTLTLSPQAGRGNKCTRNAPCYPLAPCNGEPRPKAEIPAGSKGRGEGKWPHTPPHPIPLPASGAREQMRLATPSPHEMGNRGRRPRSPQGQRAGVRGNGLIRPLTLSLSPQAGRGNKGSRRAPCHSLAP